MNNVFILHDRFRQLCSDRYPESKDASIIEELATRCNCGIENVRTWYYRKDKDIPSRYVDTIADFLDVDELYLLGLQSEEKKEETDTAAYIRMSEKSVSRIRNMTDQERETLESLLSHPAEFNRLLDTVHECVTLPDKIAASIDRMENTAPGAMFSTTTPATKDHKATTTYKRLSESDAVNVLRNELSHLDLLLNQQRPLRMDIYDLLIGIVDQIAPRQEPPTELIADAERVLSRYPEQETMTESEQADFVRELERSNVHVKYK